MFMRRLSTGLKEHSVFFYILLGTSCESFVVTHGLMFSIQATAGGQSGVPNLRPVGADRRPT